MTGTWYKKRKEKHSSGTECRLNGFLSAKIHKLPSPSKSNCGNDSLLLPVIIRSVMSLHVFCCTASLPLVLVLVSMGFDLSKSETSQHEKWLHSGRGDASANQQGSCRIPVQVCKCYRCYKWGALASYIYSWLKHIGSLLRKTNIKYICNMLDHHELQEVLQCTFSVEL